MKVILGSHSPRRQATLKELAIDFIVVPSHVDESFDSSLTVREITLRLAQTKYDALTKMDLGNAIIIAADTLVYAHGSILEKPKSVDECAEMLSKVHQNPALVCTSVVIGNTEKNITQHFTDTATVTFAQLPTDLIHALAPHFFERGCAGGFDVGEPLLQKFIQITGDITTVRGLPKEKTRQAIIAVA